MFIEQRMALLLNQQLKKLNWVFKIKPLSTSRQLSLYSKHQQVRTKENSSTKQTP